MPGEGLADFVNKIIHGDCLDVLTGLPDCSVDLVCTDPPYGLGTHEPSLEEIIAYLLGTSELHTGGDFMGKAWMVPSVAVWKKGVLPGLEARRVCVCLRRDPDLGLDLGMGPPRLAKVSRTGTPSRVKVRESRCFNSSTVKDSQRA